MGPHIFFAMRMIGALSSGDSVKSHLLSPLHRLAAIVDTKETNHKQKPKLRQPSSFPAVSLKWCLQTFIT
jgi:hypothetical protein